MIASDPKVSPPVPTGTEQEPKAYGRATASWGYRRIVSSASARWTVRPELWGAVAEGHLSCPVSPKFE